MPILKNRVPRYCHHKQTGQARVCIGGKIHYLGAYGSDESRARYDALIAQHIDRKRGRDAGLTITQLAALFWRHAKGRYTKGKGRFGGAVCWRPVLRLLKKHYGRTLAVDFGPKALQEIQRQMVELGWSRNYANDQLTRCKRMFKWAASEEHIAHEVFARLTTVEGLRSGATQARETAPVAPVADDLVDATLTYLGPKVAAMVRFQRLTGCRPGEVIRIRPRDVDRSGDVWLIRFAEHKTAHHGKDRTIYVGPQAQTVLAKYLLKPEDRYCFESRGHRCYTTDSYRRAIQRVCDRHDLPKWAPNQLRHTAGTAVREQCGLETAQAVLGHSNMQTTQIYAERLDRAAMEAAKRMG